MRMAVSFGHVVLSPGPSRDEDVLACLDKAPVGDVEEYIRAFAWFPNESVPMLLQPLLKSYLKLSKALLRDERDVIFVTHIIFGLLTVPFSAGALIYSFSFTKLVIHVLAIVGQATPYVLMLHCICHRPLFKKQFGWMDGLVHYVLAPFFGQSWNSFYYHHVRHHHVEDNGPLDLSSTMTYQRDSIIDFVKYFSRFFFLVWIELSLYFFRKKQFKAGVTVLVCESMTYITYSLLTWYSSNWLGVFCVLWVPFILMRFGMMSGNWGQHAFVDPNDPASDYRSSITCINNTYNALAFNDGYHTSHHLNSIRHWQDHPESFVGSKEKYAAKKSIVFKNIDFHEIWFRLMIKDYETMANCLVQLCPKDDPAYMKSQAEIIDFLKSRTQRMSCREIMGAYPEKC